MIDFLQNNWGNLVGVFGVIISLGGFAIAIWQIRKAKSSAQAAEIASNQTRESIVRVLSVGDLRRAIELIQRIKDFHRDQRWEVSLQHYQILRATLTDIRERLPETMSEVRMTLRNSIPQISVIENNVDRAIREDTEPSGINNFNSRLNSIQAGLEAIASSTHFLDSEAG